MAVRRAPGKTRAIAEVDISEFTFSYNLLVHSFPGRGKTSLAGTAPNSTIFSTEPGAVSAKRRGSKSGLVMVRTWHAMLEAIEAVESGQFSHRDWIAVDTVSTAQEKNLQHQSDKSSALNPKRDPDIPERADYLKSQNSFKRWIERLVDAPVNCLFLAHTMRAERPDGEVDYMPSIQGGGQDKGYPVSNYVTALMGAVGYLDVVEGKGGKQIRRILWSPHHDQEKEIHYIAKDQYACLGRYTDDWSMVDIYNRLRDTEPGNVKTKKGK